jgi:putative ABC transport system substrate-binding protein
VSISFSILGPKRAELLRELLPAIKTIALLGNPRNPNFQVDTPDIRAAADTLMQGSEVLAASTESDLEAAFATILRSAGTHRDWAPFYREVSR